MGGLECEDKGLAKNVLILRDGGSGQRTQVI